MQPRKDLRKPAKRNPRPAAARPRSNKAEAGDSNQTETDTSTGFELTERTRIIASVLLGLTFLWAYWPVLVDLVTAWDREPDYSHGYFVIPIAGYFLWVRRATRPALSSRFAWPGLAFLFAGSVIRVLGSLWYIDAVEAWTILFWAAGFAWLLGGWKLFYWSLPAIAFLGFMIPLPFRFERMLSSPLQRAAAYLSCWLLQVFGQGAINEGNVVIVNDMELLVAEACSGLRIFVSIIAIAFAYTVLIRKPWWFKAVVLATVLPVTLFSNALRIAATGLLMTFVSGEAAHRFSHDMAGFVMVPLAAALFGLVVWYLGRLIVEVQVVPTHEALRSEPIAVG